MLINNRDLNIVKKGNQVKVNEIQYIQIQRQLQIWMQTDRSQREGQKQQQINWNEFNYPPLLKLIHFRPSQLPKEKKSVVMMAFAIHITVLINTILSVIDNIAQGGLGILYSILFLFIFNPIIMFLFYRCYVGLCKQKSMLSLYIYIQPLVVIIEIVISIVDFIGFNGFIRAADMLEQGYVFEGILAIIISIVYILVALLSSYVYFLVFKKRSLLTKSFIS